MLERGYAAAALAVPGVLGCHSIRTNMHSDKTPKTPAENETVLGYCADSFGALCQYAKAPGINVIDPAPAIARQAGRVLSERGLDNDRQRSGAHTFITSGDLDQYQSRH